MFKSFGGILSEAKRSDLYWAEAAKVSFALDLVQLMERRQLTNSQLAQKLGVKAPYVTKVLRGDSNLTIESMIKLVRALGGKLNLRVSEEDCDVRWIEVFQRKAAAPRHLSNDWATIFDSSLNMTAANDHEAECAAA